MRRFIIFFLLFTFTTSLIRWVTADDVTTLEQIVLNSAIAGLIAAGVFTLITNYMQKKKGSK